jgi:hypothetical protein
VDFPSATGTSRDPDNTRARIRQIVAGTGFEGPDPYDFRHYVMSTLDDAGFTEWEIAGGLGCEHITAIHKGYLARGVVGEDAGLALGKRPRIRPSNIEG